VELSQNERAGVIGRIGTALVVCLIVLSGAARLEAAGADFLLIISGLGGEEAYRERFHEWAKKMQEAAVARIGVPEDHIWYLAEKPDKDPDRIHAKSTKENVQKVLNELSERVRPGDQVFILLIGHGSYRSEESRFNLPGPDMTAEEFAAALAPFSEQKLVFVNTASASGSFLEALSGENRVVVTATKSGLERNETVFGGYFVEAYAEEGADVNKDDAVSVLEAFEYARLQVASFYEGENRLQTEHAVLEDQDSRAASAFLAGDGRASGERPSDDPELAALYEEIQSIEDRIEILKQQKEGMSAELYMKELETLLLELARKRRALQELEKKKGERTQS
jgi:hypothetical protein